MPSRRQRRKHAAARHRHVKPLQAPELGNLAQATSVERLAYTREQAAEALGLSLTTLDRRVIPVVATVMTESGRRLIPIAELERYLADRTEQPRTAPKPRGHPGRTTRLPPVVVARILDEHQAGRGFAEIARALNTDGVPTAQGGRQWWPSTVRAVVDRSRLPTSAGPSANPSARPPQA